ncbi:hypothetical protein WUBG_19001, partial [Wuchereria bancrofti]
DWRNFEIAVLIGGGIGVTPFTSFGYARHIRITSGSSKFYTMWKNWTRKIC